MGFDLRGNARIHANRAYNLRDLILLPFVVALQRCVVVLMVNTSTSASGTTCSGNFLICFRSLNVVAGRTSSVAGTPSHFGRPLWEWSVLVVVILVSLSVAIKYLLLTYLAMRSRAASSQVS